MPEIIAPERMGIFLAQFMGQEGCSDLWEAARTMADIGYKWVQLPPNVIDLDRAAESDDYCCGVRGRLKNIGVDISEISFHIPGQLMVVHPAYAAQFASFMPEGRQDTSPQAMYEWGKETTIKIIQASNNFGLSAAVGFTGALAWPYMYPWPQRPQGLIKEAFAELAARWLPVLKVAADHRVELAFELHPGEDVFDGYTLEMFRDALVKAGASEGMVACVGVNFDPSHFVLQGLDYLQFALDYDELILAYHVKDAEFKPDGRMGAYGGYAPWGERVGKFRTPGTGQVKFDLLEAVLHNAGYDGPAVVEWEDPDQDALQGARWALRYLTTGELPDEAVQPPAQAFDDFAAGATDSGTLKSLLGLDQFSVRA